MFLFYMLKTEIRIEHDFHRNRTFKVNSELTITNRTGLLIYLTDDYLAESGFVLSCKVAQKSSSYLMLGSITILCFISGNPEWFYLIIVLLFPHFAAVMLIWVLFMDEDGTV